MSSSLPPELMSSSQNTGFGSSNEGFFATNTTWKVIGIILIVALLGFNIFLYLGNVIETTGDVIKPFLQRVVGIFGFSITDTVKQTVDVSAEGTKTGVDIVAGTLKSAVDVVEDVGSGAKDIVDGEEVNEIEYEEDEVPNFQKNRARSTTAVSGASVSKPKSNKSQNFCYVGSDRGVRTCIESASDSECASGQIFPSKDICVNPSLRHHNATIPERVVGTTEVYPAPPSYP